MWMAGLVPGTHAKRATSPADSALHKMAGACAPAPGSSRQKEAKAPYSGQKALLCEMYVRRTFA